MLYRYQLCFMPWLHFFLSIYLSVRGEEGVLSLRNAINRTIDIEPAL